MNDVNRKLTNLNKSDILSQKLSENFLSSASSHLQVFLLALLLAGCRFSPAADRPPGYLVVGIESTPLQLDPRYATDANAVRIGNLIYNSLLRPDENSYLQPELAARWRMVDERTYVFDLRRDVKFHDGKPFTA